MKNLIASLSILLFITTVVMAQSSASASTTVSANLKKGLSISQVGGSLAFGEIILNGSAQTPSISASDGARFRIIGHPNKGVTINFSNVTMNNDAWVTENGGTNGTMTFTPSVYHTGSSSTYTGATAVTSGNQYTLVNVSGDGYLYVWVGGQIAIGASQAHGDYTGSFSLNIAY